MAEANMAKLSMTDLSQEFKALSRPLRNGKTLCYLDSAASSLRPRCVADAVYEYYAFNGANVHRGVHELSEAATQLFEETRQVVRDFLKASEEYEVVFTSGTTDSLNLVAHSLGNLLLKPDDLILVTLLEHHANIVPWQMIAERTGARLKAVPLDEYGNLDEAALDTYLTDPKVKILAVSHVSNSIGTIIPVETVCEKAAAKNIVTVVDGAQGAAHGLADLGTIPCDFYAFSGHKVFGPNGIGVLCGRRSWFERMPPYRGGGAMIRSVSIEKTEYAEPPARFEAGTPHVAGVLGLREALLFSMKLDRETIHKQEKSLTAYALRELAKIDGVQIVGRPERQASIISFVVKGVHPHDLGTLLDSEGVAVRTGQHCSEPLMQHFGVMATVRASFSIYNTMNDVDRLIAALKKAKEVFGL